MTDSRKFRVSFGENRRGDKTARERGTGGRNKERRRLLDQLLVYVRANMQDPVWVSEVLKNGAGSLRYSRNTGLDVGEWNMCHSAQ